jgi:hypothetical protein
MKILSFFDFLLVFRLTGGVIFLGMKILGFFDFLLVLDKV